MCETRAASRDGTSAYLSFYRNRFIFADRRAKFSRARLWPALDCFGCPDRLRTWLGNCPTHCRLSRSNPVVQPFVAPSAATSPYSCEVRSVSSEALAGDYDLTGGSGVVMGIVGAWAGFLLRNRNAPLAVQRLQNVIVIVLMQIAFDFMTPNVSMSAHLGGLATGFLLGLALPRKPVRGI